MRADLDRITGDATASAISAGHLRAVIPQQRGPEMLQPVEKVTRGDFGHGRGGCHVSMVSSTGEEMSIMGSEIERKFLVQADGWRQGVRQRLCQCCLNRDKERTVRV